MGHKLAFLAIAGALAATPAHSAAYLSSSGLDNVNYRILAAHNQARADVGAPPLQWDPNLAVAAASYGPELSRIRRLVHSPRKGRENQRENLWMGNWVDVAHYTQMIWKTTTHVGCAIYRDGGWDYLICRYSPPGNRDGKIVP